MAFASIEDLTAYLGHAVENVTQAQLALDLATSVIQAETGQTLSLVEDDVVILRGSPYRKLVLPERPIISVDSVVGEYIESNEWAFYGSYLDRAYGWPATVVVTYTHGYEVIPLDVKAIALSAAARVLSQNDSNGPPIEQESVGSYSVRYQRQPAVSASSALLTEGERSHLRRTYRQSASMVTLR